MEGTNYKLWTLFTLADLLTRHSTQQTIFEYMARFFNCLSFLWFYFLLFNIKVKGYLKNLKTQFYRELNSAHFISNEYFGLHLKNVLKIELKN